MGAQALAGNFLARRFSILGSVRPGGGTEDHNLDTVRVFVHKSIKPIIRIKASDTEWKDCISPIDFPVQRLSFSKSVTWPRDIDSIATQTTTFSSAWPWLVNENFVGRLFYRPRITKDRSNFRSRIWLVHNVLFMTENYCAVLPAYVKRHGIDAHSLIRKKSAFFQ